MSTNHGTPHQNESNVVYVVGTIERGRPEKHSDNFPTIERAQKALKAIHKKYGKGASHWKIIKITKRPKYNVEYV